MNRTRIPGTAGLKICLYLLLLIFLTGCTRMFFYPMTGHVTDPSKLGYRYENVSLHAADGIALHAWLIKPKAPARGLVYFLHGNAENISTHFRATLWLLDEGYEVFALDYRGYGLSQGKPDVPEVFSDIDAGAAWLQQYTDTRAAHLGNSVYLYGQSLGASLAIKYAQRNQGFDKQFSGLVAEAAFSRYDSIAKHIAAQHWLTWSAQYPAKWLIGKRYDPLDAITQLNGIPKLLIHSPQDQIIPYRYGQTLFAKAAEPKQWIEAQGGHIRAAASAEVRQKMLAFMQRYSLQESALIQSPLDNQTGQ